MQTLSCASLWRAWLFPYADKSPSAPNGHFPSKGWPKASEVGCAVSEDSKAWVDLNVDNETGLTDLQCQTPGWVAHILWKAMEFWQVIHLPPQQSFPVPNYLHSQKCATCSILIFLALNSIIWSFDTYFCHILGYVTSLQGAGIFTIPRYLCIQVFDELINWPSFHCKKPHISQTSDHSFNSFEPTWIFHHPFTGQSTLAEGSPRKYKWGHSNSLLLVCHTSY